MREHLRASQDKLGVVLATDEEPLFRQGAMIWVQDRFPTGHYRVPRYLRGKPGIVESVIERRGLDNEEEAYGRNAGGKRHYYRVAVLMTDLWANYGGSRSDGLRIEVFETWLKQR